MGLLNALGGGAIVYGSMAHQENMAQLQQQLDIDRAQRIEEMKRNFAAADRATQAREINAGAEGMIDEKIGRRFASSDAAVADAQAGKTDMPMTQEQLDVIAQSKAGARDEVSDADKLRARIAAGEKAGYDMTKERTQLVSLLNHEDVAAVRRETEQNKKEYYDRRLSQHDRELSIREANGGGRGSRGSSGVKDDHWDDKSDRKDMERSDKWISANYKIKGDDGKMVPDTDLIDKASLVRDDLASKVGYGMAHQLVQRVINDVGRDKARGMSTDELTALAVALVRKRQGAGQAPQGEAAPSAAEQKPAGMVAQSQSEDFGFDPAKDFDNVYEAAKQGSGPHKRQLQAWIDGNDLPGLQARKAKSLLK